MVSKTDFFLKESKIHSRIDFFYFLLTFDSHKNFQLQLIVSTLFQLHVTNLEHGNHHITKKETKNGKSLAAFRTLYVTRI